MKSHILCLFLILLFPCTLFAQEVEYLFPEFRDGTVVYKNGSSFAAKMNYNCLEEALIFKGENGTIQSLADPGLVYAVTINERCFLNVNGGMYYEQVPAGETFYYIRWFTKVRSKGKAAGYGGYSQLEAATHVYGVFDVAGGYKQINSDELFSANSACEFYLKVGEKYRLILSVSSLTKLFKEHKMEIEAFVKKQDIDFSNPSDIGKVAIFCQKFSH